MDKKFEGYAIYGKSIVKGNMPFAVVSNNEVCRAIASYIPNQFKDCLIAIEDRRFRQHRGLDFRSIRFLQEEIIWIGPLGRLLLQISISICRRHYSVRITTYF